MEIELENGVEVGKKYTLRNGLTTSKVTRSMGIGNYMFQAEVIEPQHDTPSIMYWKVNGRSLVDYLDHKHDIIKELKQ
jgi:hypothetical protein